MGGGANLVFCERVSLLTKVIAAMAKNCACRIDPLFSAESMRRLTAYRDVADLPVAEVADWDAKCECLEKDEFGMKFLNERYSSTVQFESEATETLGQSRIYTFSGMGALAHIQSRNWP